MFMVTPKQVKLIHTLLSRAGLDDENYRDILARYGAESCKTLTQASATLLIRELSRIVEQRRSLSDATPAQRRLLLALWNQVSRAVTPEDKRAAFNTFLNNRFSIKGLDKVRRDEVEKIVKTLEAMGASRLI
ncbi:DUF1018 domain-containing protein [bacterium]|nr:DUF1018 domain-containing protein [bacterium]MBP5435950.1 DUF1018 domain-containing protein [bacterium]